MTRQEPVSVGLIGAGQIGSFHAETVTQLIVGANLAAIADPAPGAAESLARSLGVEHATLDVDAVLADPAIEAVIIAAPAKSHADIVVAAAEAGKAVFCEKPMALTLADADRAIAATRAAKVPLQIGFNRRWDHSFVDARAAIADARIGTPQLLRSTTRDPGPLQIGVEEMPVWTIFYETLIHDFDTLLSLNPGAEPVEVFAMADALIRPGSRAEGFYDTAVVTIRFDNGAMAVAEASFSALYGYDVRAEAFGSKGMVTMGDVRRSSMALSDVNGVSSETWHHWTDRFRHAYTAQLRAFVETSRGGLMTGPSGEDARRALSLALAAIRSVSEHRFVEVDEL